MATGGRSTASRVAHAGEVFAVVGPDGAGQDHAAAAPRRVAGAEGRPRPHRVGWVLQHPAIFSKLAVREKLRLFARHERVADVDAAVERMLDQRGLQDRAEDEEAAGG